jgi:hypothetical protein
MSFINTQMHHNNIPLNGGKYSNKKMLNNKMRGQIIKMNKFLTAK